MHAVAITFQELDYGENEVVWLVERVENLVLGDGDSRRTRDAALDFEKAQSAGARLTTFDVVAKLFEFTVGGFKAKRTLDFHDDCPSASRRGLCVHSLC